jgi:hypothetical protein
MQTFDLMTGYNVELRIKVNRRWKELEVGSKKLPSPKELAMLVIAAEEIKEQSKWCAYLPAHEPEKTLQNQTNET